MFDYLKIRILFMIAHPHPHKHKEKTSHGHATELWRGLHKDWRTWAVIGLMLAAIGTYVLTLDDSIQASGPPANTVTTTTAPSSPAK